MSAPDRGKAVYGPMLQKTYAGALNAFLQKEIPSAGGPLVRDLLVQNLLEITDQYLPLRERMRPGQIQWTAVRKDATVATYTKMRDTPLVSVILDLVPASAPADRMNGVNIKKLRKDSVARLFIQADQQGGCLTSTDVAVILNLPERFIYMYIKEIEAETGKWLPRRGTVHDLGPTLSHKKMVIHRWLLERKTIQQIIIETDHSKHSIHRYIKAFQRVLLCYKKSLTPTETSRTLQMGIRLVLEYWDLIEIFKENGDLDDLLQNSC